ncbi:MAG: bifunctional glycosyltransferase/class I SAM-dependent methyltransferase [candidate division WOR-3 bacterium]
MSQDQSAAPQASSKKIAIFIVAYNAVSTLTKVLDRIPDSVRARVSEIYVFDDSSRDDTYLVGVGYKTVHQMFNLNIYRNPVNLGYGGNQKQGYEYAIRAGYDIVVLLHGDGQYAPESLEDLIGPLERGEADAVFGSRMMPPWAALKGGMPLYKWIGNRILSAFENRMLGMKLTEFHSGYRAYTTKALAQVPFMENSNDFHFDTEIIIQFHQHNLRIVERPIPTYYGDEICYVNGLKYAYNVVKAVIQYRLQQAGFRSYPKYALDRPYGAKQSPASSHRKIAQAIKGRDLKILDLGCGQGHIADLITNPGTQITGIDLVDSPGRSPRVSRFIGQDLEREPDLTGLGQFDYVLLADILEHVRNPLELLRASRTVLKPGGAAIVCVPNVAHWSVRLSLLFGRFNYRPRGIMDETHVRFYTKSAIRQLLKSAGFEVSNLEATPVPLPDILGHNLLVRFVHLVGRGLSRVWKTMFGYQFVIVARPGTDR